MKHIIKNIVLLSVSFTLIILGIILAYFDVPEVYIKLAYGMGFLVGGYYTFIHSVKDIIKNKALNVDFLMIIAAIGAFYIKEYKEGAVLILIFGLSHILEDYAILKSEKSFMSLLSIAPDEATLVLDNGEEKIVNVSELKIGETIKVKVGEQVSVDGTIIEGFTALDEKAITGEFIPKEKTVGDVVYAGTINVTSTVLVKVDKDAKETVAQNIVNFVKTAQQDKTEKQTWLEKFEIWYVYVVILLALFSMFIMPLANLWTQDEALYKGIIVLVVASPCALVASVTPAILSSLSNGAKQGILIKGGTPLEKVRAIDTVVFDKTGTITKGLPVVESYVIYDVSEEEFLKVLVSIEKESNHPLAKAIVNHFSEVETVSVTTKEVAGIGIEGKFEDDVYLIGRFKMKTCQRCEAAINEALQEGFTVVNVAKNKNLIGFVKLKDTIRKEAYEVIKALNNKEIATLMLTGDNNEIARGVVKDLNIKAYKSELLPKDKVAEVKKLKERGNKVMMIGDGINDAPALAYSDVSVAMGSATDVSIEVADIVFINDDLESVNKVFALSRKMNNIIMQNVIFSIAIIIILLLTNLFSFMPISLGVIGHEGSTILVILNSFRLLQVKGEKKT